MELNPSHKLHHRALTTSNIYQKFVSELKYPTSMRRIILSLVVAVAFKSHVKIALQIGIFVEATNEISGVI
jgi:hypothetical protein